MMSPKTRYPRPVRIRSKPQAHAELFLLAHNPADWEARYLNPSYHQFRELGHVSDCSDVFQVSTQLRRMGLFQRFPYFQSSFVGS